MAAPWYRGGPKLWSKWVNPRPIHKIGEIVDTGLIISVILTFVLSTFSALEQVTGLLVYIVLGFLLLHIYGLIFRTER